MKVLHVITGLDAGGAEQALRQLLRHTTADADVLSLTRAGVLADGLVADGVRVAALGMAGNRDVGALPRLVRFVRAQRYDLVHTHLYRAQLYGALAARLAGVRVVVSTEHSLNDTLIEGRPVDRPGIRRLYLAAARLTRMTIAVSEPVGARLAAWGVPADRITVVPVGIDAASFAYDPAARSAVRAELGIGEHTTLVGGVGRLVPPKRFDVLLRALAPLSDTMVVLVGDGVARAQLAEVASELGMADRVRFTGQRLDMARVLSAVDVFASPSPEETFGISVLEALAAGLPVVYAAAPALTALPTAEREHARLAPPDPDAFRAAVTTFRGRPRRAAPPGALAHYDVAASAERIDALYEQCLASTAPGAAAIRRRPRHG